MMKTVYTVFLTIPLLAIGYFAYQDLMTPKIDGGLVIYSAFSFFMSCLGAGIAYLGGKFLASQKRYAEFTKLNVFFWFVCLCMIGWFLGFAAAKSAGTHTEDDDPLFGGGYTVSDYSISKQERLETKFKTFFIIVVFGSIGINAGYKEAKYWQNKIDTDERKSQKLNEDSNTQSAAI